MLRVRSKRRILCPGPENKFGRRVVKLSEGELFWFDGHVDKNQDRLMVCRRYESISKYKYKYFDAVSFPKNMFTELFEVLYEI